MAEVQVKDDGAKKKGKPKRWKSISILHRWSI